MGIGDKEKKIASFTYVRQVGRDGCEQLCRALESNRTLTHLDLGTNELDAQVLKSN